MQNGNLQILFVNQIVKIPTTAQHFCLTSPSPLIAVDGREVLQPHHRRGPRAPDAHDGGGAADLAALAAGQAVLAVKLQVRAEAYPCFA